MPVLNPRTPTGRRETGLKRRPGLRIAGPGRPRSIGRAPGPCGGASLAGSRPCLWRASAGPPPFRCVAGRVAAVFLGRPGGPACSAGPPPPARLAAACPVLGVLPCESCGQPDPSFEGDSHRVGPSHSKEVSAARKADVHGTAQGTIAARVVRLNRWWGGPETWSRLTPGARHAETRTAGEGATERERGP
jgi:hypothetical protein